MSEARKRMSCYTKNRLTELQRNRCFWCGKILKSHVTVDHLFPIAVYKWTRVGKSEEENEKFKEDVNNFDNLVIAHEWCNVDKGSVVMSPDVIVGRGRTVNRDLQFYNKLTEEYKDRIKEYLDFVASVVHRQSNRCFICTRYINTYDAVVRRIDKHYDKVSWNACCLCSKCNVDVSYHSVSTYLNRGVKSSWDKNLSKFKSLWDSSQDMENVMNSYLGEYYER